MQLSEYIRVEQAKALYKNLAVVLPGNAGISILTVYVLWDAYSRFQLTIWLIAALLIVVLRGYTSRHFNSEAEDPERSRYWLNLFVFWAFMTGLNWGLIPVFFYSEELPAHALIITCLYAGYMSASMTGHSFYFPAFLGFAVPVTVLFAMRNYIESWQIYPAMMAMMLIYFLVLLLFSRAANASFLATKKLNYENIRLMEEITLQKEAAENAVLVKSRFLAAASHDLRQPLHAIGLFVDALKPHLNRADGEEILGKITQSTHALNELLHRLLDISRLDASVVENHPKHISTSRLLSTITEEYRQGAKQKGLDFICSIKSDHIACVDPALLERVLRNIIDNAVKYTASGVVSVQREQIDGAIRIQIADTGSGIPEEQQEHIFSEFYQIGNPERDRNKGLGLGLSIVKRLCDLMDVGLDLQSSVGKGTTVTLTLPIGKVTEVLDESPPASSADFPKRVLAIDDEKDILDAMQYLFKEWNSEVVTATSCKKALVALVEKEFEPDIIIADFRLRDGKNGLQAIAEIREELNQSVPAILVTGDTAPDRVKIAMESDVAVLYKPIQSDKLKVTISELLESALD